MFEFSSDVAFTPAVKRIQSEKGSRGSYAKVEAGGGWKTTITDELKTFLRTLDMFYLATANAAGQPYVQYRGGAPGFLKPVDDRTLGFADFSGNRQYITLGNLSENQQAFIFLMDYSSQRRVKLWGTAEVVEGDADVVRRLTDSSYKGRVERAMLFHVQAWDVNCPQHIHKRFSQQQMAPVIQDLQAQIADLQQQLAQAEAASA
jgi:predicted pyridoxine 5'-phosphate oxidase superfamily flavin-nucleotide-binding protein